MHGKADDIVAAIDQSFKGDNVPWKNVLQVMSDSPNVVRGSKSGVATKIKERLSLCATVCKKLIQTLPLTNIFLHDLQFLIPISKELAASEAAFVRVSRIVRLFTMVPVDEAVKEWRLYSGSR